MPGEATALIAAFCYSMSYVLLRKGQTSTSLPDHGLFPVLFISTLTLGVSLVGSYTVGATMSPFQSSAWMEATIFSALSGLIGTWLGRMALYAAIDYLGATRGVVIKSAAPVVTLIIAVLLLRERLDDLDTTGMFFLLVGIALILVDRQWRQERGLLDWLRRGVVFGVLAALLQGVGHAMRKLGTIHPISAIVSATIDVGTAFLLYTLWLAVRGDLRQTVHTYVQSFHPFVVTAGFLSAAGVLLFFTAVRDAPVSTVSVIIGTEPALVTVLSALLLRRVERLTWITVLASTLVVVGIILTSLDQRPARTFAEPRPAYPSLLATGSLPPVHWPQMSFYEAGISYCQFVSLKHLMSSSSVAAPPA